MYKSNNQAIADVLLLAAAEIQEHGVCYTKGTDSTGALCTLGAIAKVVIGTADAWSHSAIGRTDHDADWQLYDDTVATLADAIKDDPRFGDRRPSFIVYRWHDGTLGVNHKTRFEVVAKLQETAAAVLESKELVNA
jgi:hypothetical protein